MANFSAPKNPLYAIPRDTAEFHSFIADQITPSGDLATDYRDALRAARGETGPSRLSPQDEFKLWWEASKPYL